ncbi:MAG: hypothetical protein PHW43_00350 [Syntrophales bacterium]|nr:hypothetical protein [Syntrophales bacterium]
MLCETPAAISFTQSVIEAGREKTKMRSDAAKKEVERVRKDDAVFVFNRLFKNAKMLGARGRQAQHTKTVCEHCRPERNPLTDSGQALQIGVFKQPVKR